MHWADHYLAAPYRHGARGPTHYDCWGFVWHALAQGYGCELPAFGRLTSADDAAMQAAHADLAQRVRPCAPQDGAIAAVYHGARFVHVGLVLAIDGRLWVQHTNAQRGAERVTLRAWQRRHPDARFYCVAA